jgi:putative transposase
MRKIIFAKDEYYHIYNRGVDKREVFLDTNDYERFFKSTQEFNGEEPIGSLYEKTFLEAKLPKGSLASERKPLVEIIVYCLNPNHYHFILKQLTDKGIEKFMQRLGTGYTKYFNIKNKRSGSLFQGTFKAIHVDSNEYLLYVSAYVNKNNFIHGYTKDDSWKYSSWPEYLGKVNPGICSKEIILGQFKNTKEYKEFIEVNAEYLKEKKEAEKYLLE